MNQRGGAALVLGMACVGLAAAAYRLIRRPRSIGARTGRIVLFESTGDILRASDTPPVTLRGARDAVERFIPLAEFPRLFGGYAVWGPPADPIPELPHEAVGVWSRRTCQRFRRILRERGAELEIRAERGPEQRIITWAQRPG